MTTPNTGWVKDASPVTWSSGFDLSLGPVIKEGTTPKEQWPDDPLRARHLTAFIRSHSTEFIQRARPFDVVDDDFSYTLDLKIGIVVYNAGWTKDKDCLLYTSDAADE